MWKPLLTPFLLNFRQLTELLWKTLVFHAEVWKLFLRSIAVFPPWGSRRQQRTFLKPSDFFFLHLFFFFGLENRNWFVCKMELDVDEMGVRNLVWGHWLHRARDKSLLLGISRVVPSWDIQTLLLGESRQVEIVCGTTKLNSESR